MFTFHRFQDLPDEIRLIIWREFYLEPRFYIARDEWRNVDIRDPLSGLGVVGSHGSSPLQLRPRLSKVMAWTFAPPEPSSERYYRSIDTSIDRMSRDVAMSIRSKFQPPAWGFPSHRHLDKCTPLPPGRYLNTNSESVFINWNADFICFRSYLRIPNDSERCEWWTLIRNLVLAYTEDWDRVKIAVTEGNRFLWSAKHLLGQLEELRQVHCPVGGRTTASCAGGDGAFFQTRYLLREAAGTPPGWKHMAFSQVYKITLPPKRPKWGQFVQRLIDRPGRFYGAAGVDLKCLSMKEEEEGARILFGRIVDQIDEHPTS